MLFPIMSQSINSIGHLPKYLVWIHQFKKFEKDTIMYPINYS